MRVCERCRRAFECVAESTVRLCKVCAIAYAALAAPHDLPHNHNESAPPPAQSSRITVVASSSASPVVTNAISWHIPPRRPSG